MSAILKVSAWFISLTAHFLSVASMSLGQWGDYLGDTGAFRNAISKIGGYKYIMRQIVNNLQSSGTECKRSRRQLTDGLDHVDCSVKIIFLGAWSFYIHYGDVIMGMMPSQITSVSIVYSTVCSGTDQRKHQSSVSLAFVRGIHRDRWIPRTKGQ